VGFLDAAFGDGGFTERLGETLQDAGWFVAAPMAAAYDIAKAGLPGGEPFVQEALKSVVTGFDRGTQLFLGDEGENGDNEGNLLDPAVGKALDGLEWLYDEAITPAVALNAVVGQRLVANVRGVEDNENPFDLKDAWNETDEGNRSSIGREFAYLHAGIFGNGQALTEEGQRILDEDSRTFDVMSGTLDAAARIILDPTIVLGKGAKALRTAKVVAGVKDPTKLPELLAQKTDGLFAGFGKRHDEAVKFAVAEGRTAGELMAAFPGLRESLDGPAVASVLEATNRTLRKAGASEDEIIEQAKLITRASMGDGDALIEISDSAAFAKDALAAMKSSRDDLKMASEWAVKYGDRVTPDDIAEAAQELDLVKDMTLRGRDYFTTDEFVKLTDARLTAVKKDIQAAEREAKRQSRVHELFADTEDKTGIVGTLNSRPMLASATGSTKGLEKRAARERGENVGLDFVFQSTAWNKGVKYAAPHLYLGQKASAAYRTTQQPRVIEVHDERAPLALDNFLKHSKLNADARLALVSEMASARSEHAKRAVVEHAMQAAQESMVRAYREKNPHFTEEVEKLVNLALAKEATKDRTRLAAHTQMFTAHKTDEGARADLRINDAGEAEFVPLLDTQLVNVFALPDLRKTEHILSRHSNWMTDMAAWAKGERAPDQNKVKEIAARVFDTTVEHRPGLEVRTANRAEAINKFSWRSEELAKDLLGGFTRIWKYGALATRPLAYSMRVNIDSAMRFQATMGPAAWMMHASPRAFGYATMGGASRSRMALRSYRDNLAEVDLRKSMERIEDTWRASNDSPIEGVAQFLERQRRPEPGIRYSVDGDPTPKLLRINDATGERIESDLDHVYRVVSADDYARMKANGYLDSSFNEPEAGQVGMVASAVADERILAGYGGAPSNVLMRIRVKPGDGWVRDTIDKELDGWPMPHLSNPNRVPFDRVTAVSPRFKGDERSVYRGEPKVTDLDADISELYDSLKAEHATIKARLDLYRTGGRKGRREAYGAFGEAGMKSIKTRAGEIPGAFADDFGKTQRYVISSETSAAIMGDSNKLALKNATTGNWRYKDHTDPDHLDSWMHAVNAQLLQSVVGKKALEFQMKTGSAEQASVLLARWAKSTPEGRELMNRLQWTAAGDKQAYSREIVGYVNHYLPTPELRQKAYDSGRLKQVDFETAVPDVELRPPVHGESIAIATGRGSVVGEQLNNTFSAILRWASDATEDQLARHPMYAAVYEQEAKRRAEFLLADPRIESLTGGDIKRLIQDQAHKKARESIKRYMFDVATTSDLSHFMRFTSPFIAAWEDTVRKWGRIAMENPDLPGKAYLLWNMPNDMGMVVDKDGNPVDSDDFNDETYIVIPKGISKHLPGGADSDFRIPKQALNIVLQGGLQPGFGPLVAYPTSKIQTAAPELDDVARIINPYGPPEGVWDAVSPSVVKRITELTNDQSRAHAQDTKRIYGQLLAEYRNDPEKFGGVEPTIEDAAKRAGALGRLKILNNFANPFPAIFTSPYQAYVDAYRTLQERERTENHERGWADDEFIKGYGESYFPLVQSMSKNNAGLGSSSEAVLASKKYKSEISKYGVEAGQANPNLIRLIVGQEGEGDFNSSAHRWQETREISPASGLQYRSYDNPQQAQADADADLGWYKYRQFMNTVDALALEKGLRSYADDEELVATRKEFVENLKAENEAWHVEWSQRDSDKFERDLSGLGELANSSKFVDQPGRTDMAGVRQYLALRQALTDQLTEYGVTPGSQDAIPFKQEFTEAVHDLVSQNTQFAEWSYYMFLERDPLLEPVGVPVAPAVPTTTSWGF